jgi:hypothetical protein
MDLYYQTFLITQLGGSELVDFTCPGFPVVDWDIFRLLHNWSINLTDAKWVSAVLAVFFTQQIY